ncbi:branched-chain amino acid ABC transporter permease [bacterium]|nr:MAG: branched-chain amino acid ABC transporter permease [bacterium]
MIRSGAVNSLSETSKIRYRNEKRIITGNASALILLVFVLGTLLIPVYGNRYIVYISTLIIINAIAAQGLNFLIGYTGQISLGHGGFMAIGAYLTAILCHTYHYSFWIVLPLVPLVTGCLGLLIALPALRLKGLYLAIMTLAFHMVVALGAMSLDITGGYQGIDVPKPHIGSLVFNTETHSYYLALIMGFLFFLFSLNLSRTKIYRAFIAIKEREISAQSMGISLWGYKILAFFLSSVYAGVAGSLFAISMGHITPNHFPLMVSIELIMMNIVGGPGSILGILLGTVLVTILPYFLLSIIQIIGTFFPMAVIHFADVKLVIYGVIIVVFLMYIPGGFRELLIKILKYFSNTKPG